MRSGLEGISRSQMYAGARRAARIGVNMVDTELLCKMDEIFQSNGISNLCFQITKETRNTRNFFAHSSTNMHKFLTNES